MTQPEKPKPLETCPECSQPMVFLGMGAEYFDNDWGYLMKEKLECKKAVGGCGLRLSREVKK